MEVLKGYKTVGFFVLVLAVALANLVGFGDFHMDSSQQELFNLVVPVAGLFLRYLTTSPIGKS